MRTKKIIAVLAATALAITGAFVASAAQAGSPSSKSVVIELCPEGAQTASVTINAGDTKRTWRVEGFDGWAEQQFIGAGGSYTFYPDVDSSYGIAVLWLHDKGDLSDHGGGSYWHTVYPTADPAGQDTSYVSVTGTCPTSTPTDPPTEEPDFVANQIEGFVEEEDCEVIEDSVSWAATSSLSVAPPSGVEVPYGVASFSLECSGASETQVTLVLPAPVAELYKYQNGTWVKVTGAVFSGNSVTYTLVDGGPLDADGVVNGTIVDPVGPARAAGFTG